MLKEAGVSFLTALQQLSISSFQKNETVLWPNSGNPNTPQGKRWWVQSSTWTGFMLQLFFFRVWNTHTHPMYLVRRPNISPPWCQSGCELPLQAWSMWCWCCVCRAALAVCGRLIAGLSKSFGLWGVWMCFLSDRTLGKPVSALKDKTPFFSSTLCNVPQWQLNYLNDSYIIYIEGFLFQNI